MSGFTCKHCGQNEIVVIDTRETTKSGIEMVRRRRHCTACGDRQTSFELWDDDLQAILDGRVIDPQLIEQVERTRDMLSASIEAMKTAKNKHIAMQVKALDLDIDMQNLKSLFERGLTRGQMAVRFGCSIGTIDSRLEVLREAGEIGERKKGPSPIDLDMDMVKKMYEDGASYEAIGREMGVSGQTVASRLKAAGVAS